MTPVEVTNETLARAVLISFALGIIIGATITAILLRKVFRKQAITLMKANDVITVQLINKVAYGCEELNNLKVSIEAVRRQPKEK